MKTQKRHLVILSLFFATLLGWCNMAQADIYWKPSSGNDSNNGSNAASAVKSFEKAKSLVSSASDWIILCEIYTITADITLDGSKGSYNVSVKRTDGLGYLMDVKGGCTLTLENITISGGLTGDVQGSHSISSGSNALIFMESNGSAPYSFPVVVVKAGAILRDNWSTYGPAIKSYDGGTIRIEGGEITNCGTGEYGGAISMFSNYGASYFYMSGGKIHHCYAKYGGGAFDYRKDNYVNTGYSMTIEISGGEISDCKLSDDKTAFGGGAFYINSEKLQPSSTVSFTMTGGTIEECTAPQGGALFVTGKNTLNLNGGTIDNCEATGKKYTTTSGSTTTTHYYKAMGGAIYMVTNMEATSEQNSSISMGGTTIQNCEADSIGGGVYMRNLNSSSTVTMTMNAGSTIDACSSTNYNGGGVYMAGKATFNMNGGEIKNCTGLNGAGVFMTSVDATATASFTMDDGAVINNCTATHDGGGVYMNKQAIFSMNGGEIKYCHVKRAGGGVAVVGDDGDHMNSVYVYGGEIHHCDALPDSGTSGNGGGLHLPYCNVLIDGENVSVHDNATSGYGGGINLQWGNLTINDGKIYNNRILNWDQGGGGAIHFSRSHVFTMTGGEIYGNSSAGTGGVFHASYVNGADDYIRISGGKIYNNTAVVKGGAFNINTGSLLEFVAGSGGQSVEMYGNKSCRGGAVSIDGGLLNIEAGSFHDNEADETLDTGENLGVGGAFWVTTINASNTKSGKLAISGGEFYNNVASQDGGVIYLQQESHDVSGDEPSVTISGGTIHNNTATNGNGGGIYYDLNTKMYVDNGSMTVKDNLAHGIPNNVYIRTGNMIDIKSGATFSPLYVGFYTENRTPNIPVFRGTNEQVSAIYNGMTSVPMTTNVVDDSQDFSPLRPGSSGTEYNYILYFGDGSPWSPLQQTVNTLPTKVNNVYQIGTVKELTAFLWLVNNIDMHHNFNTDLSEAEMTHPEASAKLTADIDMEGQYWVPIANYTGTFDGNGYVISHLTMAPTNVSTERGLFGVNTSGTIKNVNLYNGYFGGGGSYIGTIVYQMDGGTLYNSVAQCQMLATDNTTTAGGLVGRINGGTVHSSIATCEMTGYTMGGLVGTLTSGNLYNSFANPKFTHSGSGTEYVGGLVAIDTALIENCYVRLERNQSLGSARFGMLVGSTTAVLAANNGQVIKCYAPDKSSSQFNLPATYYYLYNDDQTGLSNCDLYKKVDAPYLYNRPNDNLVGSTPLYKKLNDWVSSKISSNSELAYWKRTTAGGYSYTYNDGVANITVTGGNINDDYPMPKMKELSNVASTDGFYFDYAPSLSRAIDKYNGLTGGGTIWLYASPKNAAGADEEVNVDNDSDVLLYIDEDATLLQADNNNLTAYTSQTLKVETESRWHFISSSLSNSDIGFNYGTTSQVDFDWSENPCNVTFNGNNDDALFPIDMPNINKVDLYAFYEPEYHWLNLKRNTNSHWHMNATTTPIAYNGNGTGGNGNETYLIPGKGYLASIDKDQLLQNKGTLNNGAGTVTVQDVTYNEANAWAGLLGYNLLGNPYQSYLDFNAFITDNSGLNASKGNADPTYAVYDPEIGSYIQYKSGSSKGSRSADGMIHPHQGFMIRRAGGSYSATATFKNTMRSTNSTSPFRGEQPAFPLINLTVTDDEGNADVAVLELGRDADRGAEKLRANTCKGWLYLHYDNDDYGILFRSEVEDYQPLWFEASEAGTYTMRWETANGEFESLTLVDNIAGVVTDMLATDSYVFEANPDQYKSRFKIVIGDYKGIEENEGGASTGSASDETFAFISNGNIIVNGIGTLQVIDILGRELVSEELSTPNSQLSTLNYTPGVYVLRLTTGKGTKIQKMVIE